MFVCSEKIVIHKYTTKPPTTEKTACCTKYFTFMFYPPCKWQSVLYMCIWYIYTSLYALNWISTYHDPQRYNSSDNNSKKLIHEHIRSLLFFIYFFFDTDWILHPLQLQCSILFPISSSSKKYTYCAAKRPKLLWEKYMGTYIITKIGCMLHLYKVDVELLTKFIREY